MRCCCPLLLQLSNVRTLHLTLHGWHDIGFAAPRLLLHLSVGLPHVDDVVLHDQSTADEYEPLGTPTGVAAAAANFATSLWSGGPASCTRQGLVCWNGMFAGGRSRAATRMRDWQLPRGRHRSVYVCSLHLSVQRLATAAVRMWLARKATLCGKVPATLLTQRQCHGMCVCVRGCAGAPDPVHCDGCGYENDRADLSCVLISLLALFPRLRRLEVYTKVQWAWRAGRVSRHGAAEQQSG